MKDLFPGHYRPSDAEFRSLWTEGLFVFDTNVLLNLYSYPDSAREIFLSVLNKVIDRSWIPYQVALEFHRNRFTRIKKSNEPLLDLRDRIRTTSEELEGEIAKIEFEKRNTGIDNLQERLLAVRAANSQLAEALDLACKRLPNVGLDDPIGEKLAELFKGKVGEPPLDQDALDLLIKDGSDRYEKKIPPGYKDAKDKKDLQYRDRGLTYQGMYGDLILWRQTINHVRAIGKKDVIFITGDGKDDWWQSIDKKVLGPSPDLVYEFLAQTGTERFWMYRADQFLKNAETYLQVRDVTPETIAQVKETSDHQGRAQLEIWKDIFSKTTNRKDNSQQTGFFRSEYMRAIEEQSHDGSSQIKLVSEKFWNRAEWSYHAEICVSHWARRVHHSDKLLPSEFPDIVVIGEHEMYGYEVYTPTNLNRATVRTRIKKVSSMKQRVPISNLSLVIVFPYDAIEDLSESTIDRYGHDIAEMMFDCELDNAIIGHVQGDEFEPMLTIGRPGS